MSFLLKTLILVHVSRRVMRIPLNISLSVGPLGIGIEDGTVFFQAGMLIPPRVVAVEDLLDLELSIHLIPKQLRRQSAHQTYLAGLMDEVGRIDGSFNREIPWESVRKSDSLEFFSMIPETLNFSGNGFGVLLDLTNVSLDQALEESSKPTVCHSEDGAAYRELPFKQACRSVGLGFCQCRSGDYQWH